jgi:signal transduction histidine kinase
VTPQTVEQGRLFQFRIRGKLIVLHTCFSLALAIAILLVLRRPVRDVVYQSEERECALAIDLLTADPVRAQSVPVRGIDVDIASAEQLGLSSDLAQQAVAARGKTVMSRTPGGWPLAIRHDPATGNFLQAAVHSPEARAAVERLYVLVALCLLAIYALIAIVTEVLVLPRLVYRPIERLYSADEAVQQGRRDDELISESDIPRDELGKIMQSRNRSILKLREQEAALNRALEHVEAAAVELKRKNHLLETARRNLADQDRLASLGMMSAGIAHEINTPLAVLKGCVEQVAESNGSVDPDRITLMLRVTRRLERLSESLLDFARARPPSTDIVALRPIIDESWTLVSLDRDAKRVRLANNVDASITAIGDADRLTQVFVNIIRNAVDAMDAGGDITVTAAIRQRDEREWVSVTIADDGPGIDPDVLPRLFEPFASTRLDSHGTGLGLAVAEGIVREHGGVVLAKNAAPPTRGAVFEVMLPITGPTSLGPPSAAPATPTAHADTVEASQGEGI